MSDSPDCVDRLLSIVASVNSLVKPFSIETSSILCLPQVVLSDLSPVRVALTMKDDTVIHSRMTSLHTLRKDHHLHLVLRSTTIVFGSSTAHIQANTSSELYFFVNCTP
jgi:hypothetical protein